MTQYAARAPRIRPAARSSAALVREIKLLAEPIAAVAESGVFEGYASLFGLADLGKDTVVPGAFAASLARRGARGVRMLWQHDPGEPIGRWLSIEEDARGLRVRGQLNLAVARAREIHALIKEGAVDGLSIGVRVERARHDRATGLRRLERLDLWEISVVTFPMLPGARVSGVKRSLRPSPAERGIVAPSLATAIRRATRRLFISPPKCSPPKRIL
jgi:HK97 family phage prohead protease